MEVGLELRRASRSAQRAGVRVRRRSGRSCSVSTRSGASFRPSATRFQAASNRSSASLAAPTRSSSVLAKATARRLDVALEVVAQLLDRPELVGSAAAAHPAAPVAVLDQLAIVQPVAQVIVQLDFEQGIAEQYFFRQKQHMAYHTIARVG